MAFIRHSLAGPGSPGTRVETDGGSPGPPVLGCAKAVDGRQFGVLRSAS